MPRWTLALAAVFILASCASDCAAPQLVPIPPAPPAVTVDVEPAPAAPEDEGLEVEYVRAVVWVGRYDFRNGAGVLVHDCPEHGLLAATCWHVVDENPDPVATLWPFGAEDQVDAEVVASDEDQDVAVLRLGVPGDRFRRWTPALEVASPKLGVAAVVPRDEAPFLVRYVMRQPTEKWFAMLADAEVRYGDSGSPVFDGDGLAGLVQGMFGPDHRYFYATKPGAVAEVLAGVVGGCDR